MYGSEPQCEEALFKARWPQGFACRECGYQRYCQLRTHKLLQRIRCKHQLALMAGTLLDNTKLPLRTWFLAVYLITRAKNGIGVTPISWTDEVA